MQAINSTTEEADSLISKIK
jgi:hypothetical protein